MGLVRWQVKPASKGASGVSTQDSATRAQTTESPGGTVGRTTTLTTTITAIDQIPIYAAETPYDSIGVDTEEDLARVVMKLNQ